MLELKLQNKILPQWASIKSNYLFTDLQAANIDTSAMNELTFNTKEQQFHYFTDYT